MRHSIDHFEKLLAGFCKIQNHNKSPIIVSYDDRERNTDVEVDVSVAHQRIESLSNRIHDIFATNKNITEHNLTARFIGDCETGETYDMSSNFARELSFVCHHATHHLFFMKMMMEIMKYEIGESSIGVANSTIIYRTMGGGT